jgi:hypothetical protein
MAQNPYASLEGAKVAVTHLTGPFRKCSSCGGTEANLTLQAPGTHAARLTCCGCGAHVSYLSRDHLAAMQAQRRAS